MWASAARRVDRDVMAVHSDLTALLSASVDRKARTAPATAASPAETLTAAERRHATGRLGLCVEGG